MYYISEEDKLKILKLIEDLLLKQYWLGIENATHNYGQDMSNRGKIDEYLQNIANLNYEIECIFERNKK